MGTRTNSSIHLRRDARFRAHVNVERGSVSISIEDTDGDNPATLYFGDVSPEENARVLDSLIEAATEARSDQLRRAARAGTRNGANP